MKSNRLVKLFITNKPIIIGTYKTWGGWGNGKRKFLSIDIIRDDVNYWLIRTNGGDWYQDFKQNNHVSITNSIVSLCDLKEVNDIEKYKKIVTSKNQKNKRFRKFTNKFTRRWKTKNIR